MVIFIDIRISYPDLEIEYGISSNYRKLVITTVYILYSDELERDSEREQAQTPREIYRQLL